MVFMEKCGLALSGGGFRAALFHLGVLAALAERGLLSRIEVISTVSGGSIIGACYYLKLKQLLEGNHPRFPEPSQEAYVGIVKELTNEFLEAVQQNPRLRLFDSPFANFRMGLESYTRTHRITELLDEHFFYPITCQEGILLRDIHIFPPELPEAFDIRQENQEREFKIPILIINATSLNTGHPWHFTGAWVGETPPKRACMEEIDTNVRLPRLKFDGSCKDDCQDPPWPKDPGEVRERLCRLKLSEAMAASAAVPGIFPPLTLRGLYQNRSGEEIVVELADGGVFDNQGVGALCREGCTYLIVSDGSGQLEDQPLLSRRAFEVVSRANSVMMDKIREEIYCRARREFQKGLSFFHLRQEVQSTQSLPKIPGPVNRPEGMVYALSCLRTDLDSFSDAEAFSLMYHGYTLALSRLPGEAWKDYLPREEWNFLAIREVLEKRRCWLMRRLEVGCHRLFKPFLLLAKEHPWLKWAGATAGLFLFGALLWRLWDLSLELPAPLLFLVPISFLPLDLWFRKFRFLRCLDPFLGLLGLLLLTPVGIWLWLWRNTADRLFLRLGKVNRASEGKTPPH
ncbi:NTE family protein (plasmid) [Methylomarinovum tepidoasis]|uniref:NTE family protein n=1 Tax=Methylomarinovum tepidoasis TaxID=2840183 RepID=A0AAU9CKM2_9GAMM|nr:patatin-like phospholipase family protein [Methylomarinovum sp. IN45]BCX89991.1 NTE family protein [Methylomarinovum sp. IN45]